MVADDVPGKRAKCPHCGAILLVPQPDLVSIDAAAPSPATLARPVAHSARGVVPTSPAISSPKRRKRRLWLALLVVAAVIAAPFAPMFPLWFGIVLLVACVATFVPRVQGLSRRLLRLNPAEKWHSNIRLTMYALIGLVLILAGSTSAWDKADQRRSAAQQAAEEAEQRRLTDEANAQVVALVAEATEALNAGDIDAGRKSVQAALVLPHANNLAEASSVELQIRYATDPDRMWVVLMGLHDLTFLELEEYGTMPKQLLSGYEEFDARATDLALAQIEEVAAARDKRRQAELAAQERREEERRLSEERRIAEAKRRQEELERHSTPLVVESWRWSSEYGYATAEGEVTNRSDIRLESVQVVVSFYTKDGQFITSSSALVEYDPILPGQTTPFEVMARYNPQMKSARLAFKHFWGGTIPYTKR